MRSSAPSAWSIVGVQEVLEGVVWAIVARPARDAEQIAPLVEVAREELLARPRLRLQQPPAEQRPVGAAPPGLDVRPPHLWPSVSWVAQSGECAAVYGDAVNLPRNTSLTDEDVDWCARM